MKNEKYHTDRTVPRSDFEFMFITFRITCIY